MSIQSLLKIVPLFALCVSFAAASPRYLVQVNTASLSPNTTGYMYFQYSPGFDSDPSSVGLSNFAYGGGGLLISPPPSGTGTFSGSINDNNLLISNTDANNDYLHRVMFGTLLSFVVEFDVPQVLIGSSGSSFFFALLDEDTVTPLPIGGVDSNTYYQGQITYDSARQLSAQANGTTASITLLPDGNPSEVPEPSTVFLVASCLVATALLKRRSR
jgi:hypothetical protein